MYFGSTIRGQAHQLVLARVDFEPAEIGEGRIQQSQRVWESKLVGQADSVAATVTIGCRCPFANAVQGEDGGFVKRRRKERACRV